ncbi:hypothetical protein D0C36_19955 [Mucilaginibacter conchicola]|uniref:Uncharacterized protein n=1 Tax=Mucilaginibacter conchicola TaxID=2303333 RepID=A0A372NSH2_9SPHI|nr:hypothetical protein [Mucilaginibacter conchicola]RFZ91213.1 hypothetical protein D0C36_19955 [Mucilaginibacter conchicola]
MGYQVIKENGLTVICDQSSDLRVSVNEKNTLRNLAGRPYLMVTEYEIKGGFVPKKLYVFEALGETGLETFKAAADFYFSILLDTELYVKEIPPDSSFFGEEASRLYGKIYIKKEADGTTGAIRTGRTDERVA